VDLWTGGGAAGEKFRAAFFAPVRTALPDFTFPARRDSKYGVSLRQRRMAELWEIALARIPHPNLASLLSHVYDPAFPPREEAWREITEVERAEPSPGVRRTALGWKGLLWMTPELPAADPAAWRPGTEHLEATGLAIFRRAGGATYVGLDYGEPGGGHGHPDRLNLTVHAGGVPWLVDVGTGSYVSRSLEWYRTTLAHNAPLVDGLSQAPARGQCIGFEESGDFGWVCAQLADGTAYDGAMLQRTLIVTPWYVLDVVQMASSVGERAMALPWHGLGRAAVDEGGVAFERDQGTLRVYLAARQPFRIQIERAPGPPDAGGGLVAAELAFPIVIGTGEEVTLVGCVDLGGEVEEVECAGGEYLVRLRGDRLHTHRPTDAGWSIDLGRGDPVELGGVREAELQTHGRTDARTDGEDTELRTAGAAGARCLSVARAPALDGTLDGFHLVSPLMLDAADQFRRREEPWGGPEGFSALAYLNHDGAALYLGVEVTAPEPAFRPPGSPDPELDNENPDLHGDGLQVYVETTGFYGWLIVPDADGRSLRVSPVRGTDGAPEMVTRGAWAPTARGYRVTLAIELPEPVADFGFDLYVNRGRAGRERRVGQLVWSGAGGDRLYLAGDRPLPGPLPRVKVS
ncbi:MAG: heparinase II/III family protein, partial [Gemmatimonadetes bacterium]|nr:heparinase II/III family protein [Gemmatimonadota bacterium]